MRHATSQAEATEATKGPDDTEDSVEGEVQHGR